MQLATDAARLLRGKAYNYSDYDDMVQEAAITILKEIERRPGQKNGYYFRAARRRIMSVVRGDRLTGQESRRHLTGKRRDGREKYKTEGFGPDADPFILYHDPGFEAAEWSTTGVDEALAELSPKHKEIARAISVGEPLSSVAPRLGLTTQGAHSAWRRAKEQLTSKLEDWREELAA
jgi:DNA-directed RNA polymerase specialized sigma24 family protein